MNDPNLFDPRKLRPYRPTAKPPTAPASPQSAPADPSAASTSQPPAASANQPLAGPADQSPPPTPGRPASANVPIGAMPAGGEPTRRPDDIPLREGETVVGLLILWSVSIIVAYLLKQAVANQSAWHQLWLQQLWPLVDALLILIFLAFMLNVRHGLGPVEGLHLRRGPWRWTVAAALLGLGFFLAARLLLNQVAIPAGDLRTPTTGLSLAVTTVAALAAAFVMELFYRGLIFPLLRRIGGAVAAVLVTALWFGLAGHPLNGDRAQFWSAGLLVGLGLLLGLVRHLSQSLGPPLALSLAYHLAALTALWLQLLTRD